MIYVEGFPNSSKIVVYSPEEQIQLKEQIVLKQLSHLCPNMN